MQEAEVTRLEASAPARRLFRTYRLLLQIVLGALPATAIGYQVFFGDSSLPVAQRWLQLGAFAAALFVSGLTAYLAWRCHRLDAVSEPAPSNTKPSDAIPFEIVFDLAPDAVIIADRNGRVVRANRKAGTMFGLGDEEFPRLRVADLFPELADENFLHQMRPPLAITPHRLSSPALRRDGASFPAEIEVGPLAVDGHDWLIAVVRDVSEARKAAEHLRQSERQFRDIFDHAPIGMALTALDGQVMEANESLCKLLGFTHDELLGVGIQNITHPDDLDVHAGSFGDMAAGNLDTFRVERRYLHKDGTPVWTLLGVSLQRDAQGLPRRILFQIVDIGAIKAAQEALAASEMRLQRVLEGSNDGFWDRHIPSGTTTFSPRWATMLGYECSEIIPEMGSWEKLVHPDDLPVCRRILAEHLSGERDRYEAVYRMRHKSGHWVWILARGKAYEWDADGRPLRMAGTHTDVTVRQLTTEALRLRERTLKAVLEALPIGVWIADANGRITSANPAALAMGPGVRYRALAEDGKRSEDAWGEEGRTVPPHDWALARAIQRREKIGEQLVEVEFADGSKKTVLNSGAPILDEEGKPLGAIAVNQDMTQWLQLEQDLLRRTYQLEESNRELEQFAYVASHDLQEPLRKVSSFAQLFAKKYAGHLDEAGQTYINFMVDGASRMQILVDDLLHYSRLTRGDRSHQEVNMDAVLDGVLADLQLFIKETGARIDAGHLPSIQGDASQLRALLQNLVSNAVKYRAPDRHPEVHIGASVQAGEATFWVRDNGIGIDPRYFEKIFVIFQRLHARSEYPGTGIGLAICKKIVDNHAGRIWVESSPGQGATFFFTLPTGESRK